MPYTPGDVLVRAVMTAASGLPEDTMINNWAFRTLDELAPSSAELTALFGAVDGFYRDVQTNGQTVGGFIGDWVDRGATHELQAYKIQAGSLGSPIQVTNWLGPTSMLTATELPAEVSAVLSFHADLDGVLEESGSTRPRSRRRGRIYIPTITSNGLTVGPQVMLSSLIQTTMRQAAVKMYDDAETEGFRWSVWSRADSQLYAVDGGWTDDAPDTQRRRGPRTTARVAYST